MDRKMTKDLVSTSSIATLGDEELSTVSGASGYPSWLTMVGSPVVQTNVATVVQIAQGNFGAVSQGATVVQGNLIG
jgi:hypothetical protein